MRRSSLLTFAAAVALLSTAAFTVAQDQPAAGAPPQGARRMQNFQPKNLQVLPKDISPQELRETMEMFAGSLGVHCDFCHAADTANPAPNGRPRMDFASDAKPNKQIARVMYTMMQTINTDYISKTAEIDRDAMGTKVNCGTCHRGHSMPEAFTPPQEGPRGPGGPGGAPPAGPPPSN